LKKIFQFFIKNIWILNFFVVILKPFNFTVLKKREIIKIIRKYFFEKLFFKKFGGLKKK